MFYYKLKNFYLLILWYYPLGKECNADFECPNTKSCIQQRCEDICFSHSCGKNTECRVIAGVPTCFCQYGYHGNPMMECQLIVQGIVLYDFFGDIRN